MRLLKPLRGFPARLPYVVQAQHPEGVLVLPAAVWLAVLALLGLCFVWLLHLSI